MHLTKENLKKIISESGLVSDEDLRVAENESFRSGQTLTDVLIGRGALSEQLLVESLSDFFKVPIVQLEKRRIDRAVLELVPESYAKSKEVVLFEIDENLREGSLAMADPNNFEVINHLSLMLDLRRFNVYLTTASSLKFALKFYKQEISEEFSKIIEENIQATRGFGGTASVGKLAESIPIIKILDSVIEHAASLGASDIHFEPFEDKLLVRYRLDGILEEILSLSKEIAPILVARIKVIANLQIDVHNAPQDGRFRHSLENQFIDIRVSVVPTFHGEKAEMRLLKGSLRPLSLSELGLSHSDLEKLTQAIKKPHGLILVTGPTGSGKTTTLYAILEILNTPRVNITTIEDPVEYEIPRVNQIQVNVKTGLTFASGLRTIVRQNPDIVMIGEIRDPESADIAINAALTGHLLLSTLHTNDAPGAVSRLIDLNVQPFLLASTLNMVIAQRLVRRLCKICVSSRTLDPKDQNTLEKQVKELGLNSEIIPKMVYAAKGCSACSFAGYQGQVGIFEIFNLSDAIRDLIMENASTQAIRKKAREEGMRTLFENGMEKVTAGFTSLEEVLRVASE